MTLTNADLLEMMDQSKMWKVGLGRFATFNFCGAYELDERDPYLAALQLHYFSKQEISNENS